MFKSRLRKTGKCDGEITPLNSRKKAGSFLLYLIHPHCCSAWSVSLSQGACWLIYEHGGRAWYERIWSSQCPKQDDPERPWPGTRAEGAFLQQSQVTNKCWMISSPLLILSELQTADICPKVCLASWKQKYNKRESLYLIRDLFKSSFNSFYFFMSYVPY